MLRRLLVVIIPLLTALFLALAVPLAANIAQQETQATYLDRLADAQRFAALASDALARDRSTSLEAEIRRYEQLYGIAVAVVAPDNRLLLASSPGFDLKASGVRAGLYTAFAGYGTDRIDTVWPWQAAPMVVAEPVGRDTRVIAAVVTVSSTERLRMTIVRSWGLLAAAGAVPFLLVVGAAVPLSRWVVRPVHDLDQATMALAAGRLEARAETLTGPPELRRVLASFNTMADVVTRTLRRQRTFVSDASHQLRNPLASLRLAVENLSPHLTSEGRHTHADALAEAEEMGRVVDSLLALTEVEGVAPARIPQPLDAVLVGRADRWRHLLAAAGMTLIVEVPPGLATYTPGESLGHLLDELVGNAARLSAGTQVTVTAALERDTATSGRESATPGRDTAGPGDEVVLRVRDDGTGLSAEERRHAGERFWRGPAHQNVPGTGLGLPICREVVASWGGWLELHDATPHGLDVRIALPAAGDGPGEDLRYGSPGEGHRLRERK